MNILPVALTPKKILLVGAGGSAALKAKSIRESDCDIVIVAKEIKDPYFENKEVIVKEFSFSYTVDCDVVVNASGDEELSKLLWENRKRYGYLLNCVDMPKYCDFYFQAMVKNHDLCVSVSTGGAAPKYAQFIRNIITAVLPNNTKQFYENIKTRRKQGDTNIYQEGSKVLLIGCGPGSVENLTIKALRALNSIEIAMIDALISKEIIELLPKNCIKIDVSKKKGVHKFLQEEINEMLLKCANDGFRVGRLKGGDPAVFGRVFEEAAFLTQNGVSVEMINGVSSVFAGCLAGGVTPTLRGFSSGALIVSAHLKEATFNDSWIELLKDFPYTIIVLMAYSFAQKILKSAEEKGIPTDIPTAFVSNIDRINQKTVIGTLKQLPSMAKLCSKPAVLIIGKSVAEAINMPYNGERIIL